LTNDDDDDEYVRIRIHIHHVIYRVTQAQAEYARAIRSPLPVAAPQEYVNIYSLRSSGV